MINICAMTAEEAYKKFYNASQQDFYVAYWRGKRCVDEDAFFREASASFQFPDYFGENWPAFDECICDLDWLKFQRIFLLVDNFNWIFNGNKVLQNRLIEYLTIMDKYWQQEGVDIEIWLIN